MQQQNKPRISEISHKKIINTQIFTKRLQLKFLKLLSMINPSKTKTGDLFITGELAKFIAYTVGREAIQKNRFWFVSIDNKEMLDTYFPEDGNILVFLVEANEESFSAIANFLERLGKDIDRYPRNLVAIPKRNLKFQLLLEKYGLSKYFSTINTFDFNFGLVPLQEDILSLEYKLGNKEIFLQSSFEMSELFVDEIIKLKYVMGNFPCEWVQGKISHIVFNKVRERELENDLQEKYNPGTEILT